MGLMEGPQQLGQMFVQRKDKPQPGGAGSVTLSLLSSPRSPLLWGKLMIFTLHGFFGKGSCSGPQVLYIFEGQTPAAGGAGEVEQAAFSNSAFTNSGSIPELQLLLALAQGSQSYSQATLSWFSMLPLPGPPERTHKCIFMSLEMGKKPSC